MHLHFFVRGETTCVDIVMNWLKTRTINIPYWENEADYKAGKTPKMHPGSFILRYSVLGSYELIIPEQEADKWLTTLGFHRPPHPNTVKLRLALAFLRKAMGITVPKPFKIDESVMLPVEQAKHTGFIPIGVKYDKMAQLPDGYHEFL